MADAKEKEKKCLQKPIEQLKEVDGFMTSDKRMLKLAQICDSTERYQDGADIMVELCNRRFADQNAKNELSDDERNLLSNCFKNVIGELRKNHRELVGQTVEEEDSTKDKQVLIDHIRTVMVNKSELLINLVSTNLFEDQGNATSFGGYLEKLEDPGGKKQKQIENGIFYLKMCGDYFRYIAELTKNEARNAGDKGEAEAMYKAAMGAAKAHLKETSPTRLGLALNWSVCLFELLDNPKEAGKVAKAAFDDAIEKLDTLQDNSYKDSTLIMQLLRDNLTIWGNNAENQDEGGAED